MQQDLQRNYGKKKHLLCDSFQFTPETKLPVNVICIKVINCGFLSPHVNVSGRLNDI